VLIGLGGLAAVLGGGVYVGLVLLAGPYWLESLYYLDTIGYGFVAVVQPLGAMAAIVSVHALQRRRHGMLGAYLAAVAFVGLALVVGALTVGVVALSYPSELVVLLILLGLLVASAGMLLLGGLTIAEGVLPWWCGVALVGGSPLGMFLMMVPSMLFRGLPDVALGLTEAFAALGGVMWVLLGYAIFRAAGRRSPMGVVRG
jgi:hypothetical protein